MKITSKSGKLLLSAAVIIAAVTAAGAGTYVADKISVRQARELLQHLAGANLSRDQVQIKKIDSGFGDSAIIEAQIETAFRVEKEKGQWRIAEVRLGDRQWESFELIEEAVRREKARRTTAMLQQLADGLAAYRKERGQYADTDKISELVDYLSPQYMQVVPRADLWGTEFEYKGSATSYRLRSAGPDGKAGNKDDLVIETGVLKTDME